jgi:hypothetical protein
MLGQGEAQPQQIVATSPGSRKQKRLLRAIFCGDQASIVCITHTKVIAIGSNLFRLGEHAVAAMLIYLLLSMSSMNLPKYPTTGSKSRNTGTLFKHFLYKTQCLEGP